MANVRSRLRSKFRVSEKASECCQEEGGGAVFLLTCRSRCRKIGRFRATKPSSLAGVHPLVATSSENFTAIGAWRRSDSGFVAAREMRLAARDNFVDEADAIGFLGRDRLPVRISARKRPFPTRRGRLLTCATTWQQPSWTLGVAQKSGMAPPHHLVQALAALAAPPRAKAGDRRDHRGLAEFYDEVQHALPEPLDYCRSKRRRSARGHGGTAPAMRPWAPSR